MSDLTQPICEPCWRLKHGDFRIPVRLTSRDPETCHLCSRATAAGIYVRVSPGWNAARTEEAL